MRATFTRGQILDSDVCIECAIFMDNVNAMCLWTFMGYFKVII